MLVVGTSLFASTRAIVGERAMMLPYCDGTEGSIIDDDLTRAFGHADESYRTCPEHGMHG